MVVITTATLLPRGGALGPVRAPCWHWPAQDLHLRLAAIEDAVGASQLCVLLASSQRGVVWCLRAGTARHGCSGGCWGASLFWGAAEIQNASRVGCLLICILTAGWQLIALIIVIISCRQKGIGLL